MALSEPEPPRREPASSTTGWPPPCARPGPRVFSLLGEHPSRLSSQALKRLPSGRSVASYESESSMSRSYHQRLAIFAEISKTPRNRCLEPKRRADRLTRRSSPTRCSAFSAISCEASLSRAAEDEAPPLSVTTLPLYASKGDIRRSKKRSAEGGETVKRIVILIVVVMAIAAMMVASALPAFAAPPKGCTPGNSGPGNGFFASHHKCFHPGP